MKRPSSSKRPIPIKNIGSADTKLVNGSGNGSDKKIDRTEIKNPFKR